MLICLSAGLSAYICLYAGSGLGTVDPPLQDSTSFHAAILSIWTHTLDMSGLPSETAPDSRVSERSSKRHEVYSWDFTRLNYLFMKNFINPFVQLGKQAIEELMPLPLLYLKSLPI